MQNRPIRVHRLTNLMHRHHRRVIAVAITLLGLIGLLFMSILYFPTPQLNEEPSFSTTPSIPLGSQESSIKATPLKIKEIPVTQKQVLVQSGDSLSLIFDRLHLSPQQLLEILKLKPAKNAIKRLHAGQELQFTISEQKQLQSLTMPLNHSENLLIARTATGFTAKEETQQIDIQRKLIHAVIHSSFYLAGKSAHIPKTILMNFVKIFSWKYNFARDIHSGDQFSVLYQLVENMKTHRVEPGKIIAAALTKRDKTKYAFRYRDSFGRIGYYDSYGKSWRKAFLRKPVNIGYISSPFSLRRRDPILHIVRPHTGTDFAAPYGTPIHATGAGRITLRGRKGGYGRCVVINNGNGITTLFAHMSRFNPKYKIGAYVKMNDVIGYIGSSGMSTGPHVHYEYRINHRYKNPMTVKLPDARPIPAKERPQYKQYVSQEIKQLSDNGTS